MSAVGQTLLHFKPAPCTVQCISNVSTMYFQTHLWHHLSVYSTHLPLCHPQRTFKLFKILLHPKPAWSSMLFSVVVGVSFVKQDERHTNCTVHVLCGHEFFLFLPLPELPLLPAVLLGWDKRLLSCLTEAQIRSSSDCLWLETYFVHSSLSRIGSPIVFTPRGGWIGVCKSVDLLKKPTKSESANCFPR